MPITTDNCHTQSATGCPARLSDGQGPKERLAGTSRTASVTASPQTGAISTIRYSIPMRPAGEILRGARKRVGLSQAELAKRAGVTQSVVSAYESGARQPSLPTLARLVEATGLALEVDLSPDPVARHRAGPLARSVDEHRGEILDILGRYRLGNPRLFGSVASGSERPGSDIDILVDVPAGTGLLSLARCQAELEALLGAPVDIVPASALKRGLADDVAAEAVAL